MFQILKLIQYGENNMIILKCPECNSANLAQTNTRYDVKM